MRDDMTIPPTRLDRLLVTNYRGFPSLDVSFDPLVTLLVAPNGNGKTVILDAIAIALRPFVDTLQAKQSSTGFEHSDIRLKLSAQGTMEPMLPTQIDVWAHIADVVLQWSRQRDSMEPHAKTTHADVKPVWDTALTLRTHLQEYVDGRRSDGPTLPIIAY